jgi:hypothetical protein
MSTSMALPRKMRFHHWADMGSCANAFAELLPLGAGEHHQAAVGVLGDGELAGCRRAQDVTMPGRHRKPTLRIETER